MMIRRWLTRWLTRRRSGDGQRRMLRVHRTPTAGGFTDGMISSRDRYPRGMFVTKDGVRHMVQMDTEPVAWMILTFDDPVRLTEEQACALEESAAVALGVPVNAMPVHPDSRIEVVAPDRTYS